MSHSDSQGEPACSQRFEQQLAALLAEDPSLSHSKFVLALSGGADSVALLRLLLAAGYKSRLRCVHVNHQLQPGAEDWAGFCDALCQQQGVPFGQVEIALAEADCKRLGTEAAARNARYTALMTGFADSEILLTAHHADDQLETLLHRLERGTGLRGLQGIKSVSSREFAGRDVYLLRPLLKFAKADLLAYLRELDQVWIEDPSNTDSQFRRNFYRKNIVPQLNSEVAAQLLDVAELAHDTLGEWALLHDEWCATRLVSGQDGDALELQEADFELPSLLQLNLQQWLLAQQCSLPQAPLSEVIRQLQQGSALGHNPSYQTLTHAVFVRKRLLQISCLS